MKKKRREILQKEKRFSNRTLALASAILVVLTVGGILLSRFFWQLPPVEFPFRAAIVDQLSLEFPNSEYNVSGSVSHKIGRAHV